MKTKDSKPSIWSLELLLVIGLIVSVIIACVFTALVARDHGFSTDSQITTDRFARVQDRPDE